MSSSVSWDLLFSQFSKETVRGNFIIRKPSCDSDFDFSADGTKNMLFLLFINTEYVHLCSSQLSDPVWKLKTYHFVMFPFLQFQVMFLYHSSYKHAKHDIVVVVVVVVRCHQKHITQPVNGEKQDGTLI